MYFILVFAMSAPFWILGFLLRDTRLPLDIPVTDVLATLSPLLAAWILTYRTSGKAGVRQLFARLFDYPKIPASKWLAIVGIPLTIFGLIYVILRLAGVTIPSTMGVSSVVAIVPLAIFFYVGSVFEEVGYTAYLTDIVRRRFRLLGASVIIGLPWALWHVPSMLVQGRSWYWILWGVLGTIAFRLIFLWVYDTTRASVAAVISIHMLYNLGRALFPQTATTSPLVSYPEVHYGVVVLVAVVLLWASFRPRR